MGVEPREPVPDVSAIRAWLRRPAEAWALIAVCVVFAGVYAATLRAAAHPRVTEGYRRTFMTAEFRVFPESAVFAPEDGLAYAPGAVIDGATARGRRHFARFDWRWTRDGRMALRGGSGRLFLAVPDAARRPGAAHRLVAEFGCPAGGEGTRLAVSVNGAAAGEAVCADGAARLDATIPPGVFPAAGWEEIVVARPDAGRGARLGARLGLAGETVTLDRLSLTPLAEGEE
jgi:hypothetical protein